MVCLSSTCEQQVLAPDEPAPHAADRGTEGLLRQRHIAMSDRPGVPDQSLPGFRAFLRMRRQHAGSPVAAVIDFILLRLRHREVWSPTNIDSSPSTQGFESLRGHKY